MVVWVLSLVGFVDCCFWFAGCGFGVVWVMFLVNWRSVGKPKYAFSTLISLEVIV